MTYFEDICKVNTLEHAVSIFGWTSDSNLGLFENLLDQLHLD